jgi:hypothetical protein
VTTQLEPAPGRIRERARRALFAAMPSEEVANAESCAVRLRAALPRPDDLSSNVVLVAYGGGKDSSYTLAFVRALQLILDRDHGSSFRLRTATNRHAGMPHAVMENIDRAYRRLGLFDDPHCEMLLIDGTDVGQFGVDVPQPDHVARRNRADILMTGHRTFAEARPTFCNACNISMVNSFGIAAAYGDGVDLVVTGDSREEQRAYALWVRDLAKRFGIRPVRRESAFKSFLATLDELSETYFHDIHGSRDADRGVARDVGEALRSFSIYEDTGYSAGDHWELLTGFLGFSFDDLAFSFTESDCANPALMAHLRGLKCERCYDRDYADGLGEYVGFAVRLMRRKEFPEVLIQQMRERYDGADAIARQRAVVGRFAWEAYRMTEEQLVCMVYSPFADGLAGLDRFLDREHPALYERRAEVRAMLHAGTDGHDVALAGAIERISGLTLAQLRFLARRPLVDGDSGRQLIGAVLDGDPHKDLIQTRHAPDGAPVTELISGR